MLLPLLWFVTLLSIASAEVITLLNENITCVVTDDDIGSAVYVDPPTETKFHRKESGKFQWTRNDWTPTRSVDSSYGPVTDSRWSNFSLKQRFDEGRLLKDTPLSFSVCAIKSFILEIYDKEHRISSQHNIQVGGQNVNNCHWNHYTLWKNHTSVSLFSNGSVIYKSNLNYIPAWIYFKNVTPNTLWNLHIYEFQSSSVPTQSQNYSSMKIEKPQSDHICVSLFVSLDRNSSLKIVLESDDRETVIRNFNGFNNPGLRSWREVELQVRSKEVANLTFVRYLKNNATVGYWAIDDIRFCSEDQEVFQAKLPIQDQHEDYRCKLLNDRLPEKNNNISQCQNKGFIGSYCDITCASVLGEKYKNCEEHQICHGDSECFFAWDGQGKKETNLTAIEKVVLPFFVDENNDLMPDKDTQLPHSYLRITTTISYFILFLVIITGLIYAIKNEKIPPYKRFKENLRKKKTKPQPADVEMQSIEKNKLLIHESRIDNL